MGKDLSVNVLMDFYGDLLTEKQRVALGLYYNQDFSLAEIAQHMDISRQGVRDFIKRGEKQLYDFEAALGLFARFSSINAEIEKMERVIEITKSESTDEPLLRRLNKLSKSLDILKENL